MLHVGSTARRQDGYGAFTYSFRDKDKLIEYVKNQEEHHKKVTFREDT
jgi:putative transposase